MSERTKKPASAQIKPDDKKVIRWIEISVAVILLLILITLHFILLRHSGALWRDEVNSVNLVNLSSMVDFWEKFQSESFPILWFLLLRAWIFIGFGGTDLALRAFGLIIGLGALSALWYAGRILGTRLPVISLVLFAMTPVAFVGDSIRAYGLGVILILLALATMWRVIQNLTLGRMIICAIVVILNAQCLYHNSFLIFAICIGAAAVGYYRRDWKMMVFSLGTGLLAAISLLPYLKMIAIVRDCHITRILPVSLSWILDKFRLAIDPSGMLLTWVWFVLALLTVISFVKLLITSPRERSGRTKRFGCIFINNNAHKHHCLYCVHQDIGLSNSELVLSSFDGGYNCNNR